MQTRRTGGSPEPIEELKRRAARRARLALGRFGSGVAHVVLRARGERRYRRFVVALRFGDASVEEATA
jgi:hypothetical protein